MTRGEILRLIAMFLAAPAAWVGGAAISQDGAMVGFMVGGVLFVWAAALLFRHLPERYCVWAMIAAFPVGAVGAVMHNVVYGLTGAEEPFFFLLALAVAPAMLFGGFVGFVLHRVWPVDGHGLQPGG